MRRLLVAVAFLTRLPVPGAAIAGPDEVGRAALFFPAAGAVLGGLLVLARHALFPALPALLAAALLLALGALLTGALHLDGLADTADGFGGGRSREDVLRIMRDHAIGAYGASALVLAVAVELAALGALLERPGADRWILLAWTLSRWTPVPLSRWLPYARAGGGLGAAVTDHGGWLELAGATALALAAAVLTGGWKGLAALSAVAALTAWHGLACRRRIGGVTGDTLGAAIQTSEALVLVVGVALG